MNPELKCKGTCPFGEHCGLGYVTKNQPCLAQVDDKARRISQMFDRSVSPEYLDPFRLKMGEYITLDRGKTILSNRK